DGEKIEGAVKEVIAALPKELSKPFDLDAEKVEGVNVHRVRQANVDEETRKLLGDGPLYFAVRKDVVIVTLGDDALEAMKAALATKPVAAGLLKLEASLSRLAPLIAPQRKNAVEAAKEAFGGEGNDKVSVSVKGGKALEVSIRLGTAVLDY